MLQNAKSDEGLYCLHTGNSIKNKMSENKEHRTSLKWQMDLSNLLQLGIKGLNFQELCWQHKTVSPEIFLVHQSLLSFSIKLTRNIMGGR